MDFSRQPIYFIISSDKTQRQIGPLPCLCEQTRDYLQYVPINPMFPTYQLFPLGSCLLPYLLRTQILFLCPILYLICSVVSRHIAGGLVWSGIFSAAAVYCRLKSVLPVQRVTDFFTLDISLTLSGCLSFLIFKMKDNTTLQSHFKLSGSQHIIITVLRTIAVLQFY